MKYFEEQEGYLVAQFEFENFSQALDFVNQCRDIFEQHNHHGDIEIYDYCFVGIRSTTHDAGDQVTPKDKKVAVAVETLYNHD